MRMMKTLRLAALVLPFAGLLSAGRADAAAWEIDPAHSSAQFSVRHLAVSNVRGEFGKVSGTVDYDAKDPSKAKVEATIDAASINTRDEKRDGHLKSPDFFDVAKFPTITFKSSKVEKASEGKLKVSGDLTIHGVTKPAVLDVTVNKIGTHPMAKDEAAGFDASATIKRSDFGVGAYAPNVSDEIKIAITTETHKAK